MRGWLVVVLAGLAVAFPLGSSAKVVADYTWAGTWSTNFGEMTLNAGGSGTYEFCDGKISGSVSGNKLTGTWTQRTPCGGALEGSGSFEFTMNKGGDSWTGRWHYAGAVGSTGWRYDWSANSCLRGPCRANGDNEPGVVAESLASKGPIRKGLIRVSYKDRKFVPTLLNVASGATLKICNNEAVFRAPFTNPRTAGPNTFKVLLKPGACMTRKLVNTGKAMIRLVVFDVHVGQTKVVIFIHTAK